MLFFSDTSTSECSLPNCDICNGDNCTQCSASFFNSEYYGCIRCYIGCFYCYSGEYVEYFKCGDSSCGCDVYNNFPSDRNSSNCLPQQSRTCKCPPGYFHHIHSSFCYKCSQSNCKCTEADNCPECIPGKYNTSNFCQDSCPDNCVNCTDENFCGDCISGKYGILCDSDCIDTCEDGTCDKMLGICTGCPFGKYPDSSNIFGVTYCIDCPGLCTGCIGPNNCTLCSHVDHWGTTCQHDCTGCEGVCIIENGCSVRCHEGYYQGFSITNNGFECLECQPTCKSCDSWASCQTCSPGFWGSQCQYSCTGCTSDCDNNGCSSGCVRNYYRHLTDGGYQCIQCPDLEYLAIDDVGCVPCSAIADESCNFAGCASGSFQIYDEAENILKCDEVQCPDSCLSCANDEQCDSCKPNHWGGTCQYNCSGCSGNCQMNNGCSEGCDDKHFQTFSDSKNGYECINCPQNCLSCRSSQECDTCEPLKWGNVCQHSCTGCSDRSCNVDNGCSEGCDDKYFQFYSDSKNGYECIQCSQNCSSCVNNYECVKCEPNKWGILCQYSCLGCSDKCHLNSGCSEGCDENYSQLYSDSKNGYECIKCLQNCVSCTNDKECETCELNKWGNLCQYSCLGCSDNCHLNSGCSYGCEDKYFQLFSGTKNGYECIQCSQNCSSCRNEHECEICEPNKWGNLCQYSCSGCSDSCHTSSGCSNGCDDKYFQLYSDSKNGYECIQCLQICASCTNDQECETCEPNKWGNLCQYSCSGCSDNCDFNSGCSQGCDDNYSQLYNESKNGYECIQCLQNCSSCVNSYECDTCEPNTWGNLCQYSCLGCRDNCHLDSGCSDGCEDKYFQFYSGTKNGYDCIQCSQNCSSCTNDRECVTCEPNKWGNLCQYICSGCDDNCHLNTGCSRGCDDKYFQSYSETKNGYECIQCPSNCSTCKNEHECTTSECSLPNCDICNGDNCTQCSASFFNSEHFGCIRCYISCFYCSSGQYVDYYKCGDSSCGCDVYNNLNPDRTSLDCMPQPQVCYKCPPGYFHPLGSAFCYKCSHSNCKCTEADNCPECMAGKHNTSNFCQDECPDNCINCTDTNFCGDCINGKYGILCDSDCINTCEDGTCDKMFGICTGCPFGKYPDSSNNFNITFCMDCPGQCAGCLNPNNCTLCSHVDHWGTTCQHYCTGCEGECSIENGCSTRCHEGYYQGFSITKNGYECLECQPTCHSCDSWMSCQTCFPGFWGSRCQYSCTGCTTDCDNNGCSSGCVRNYYRHLTDGGYQCKQCSDLGYLAIDDVGCVPCSAIADDSCTFVGCDSGSLPIYDETENILKCDAVQCPESCLSCTSEEQCDSCKPNLWGRTCQHSCSGCSDNCQMNNGCSEGCDNKYFQTFSAFKNGYECIKCPQNCSRCSNSQECDSCEAYTWGNMCQYSCLGCSTGCDKLSGCGGGCLHGYYNVSIDGGILCEKCPGTCKNQTCSSFNGMCTAGCENSWTGLKCDTKCFSSCLTCEQKNLGVCKICKDGSLGPDCKTSSASVPFVSTLLALTLCMLGNFA